MSVERKVVMKNILLTGRPGSGKSSLIKKLAEGRRVGGITTPEIRKRGLRWGFEIVDLRSGKRGVLASVEEKEGPQVSKYRANLENLNEIGVSAIENAIDDPYVELIVIDEIGKMEFFSEEFRKVVKGALNSDKPVLAAISLYDFDPFIKEIKARSDAKLFVLERGNFDKVLSEIQALLK